MDLTSVKIGTATVLDAVGRIDSVTAKAPECIARPDR